MNTKILTINDINIASNIIKAGGLVAFPTETVYGLGANGLNGKAVNKIFVAKGRPRDNPLILHVSSIAEVKKLVEEIPQTAKKLMISFWPGPLTIIFKKSEIVPDEVTCGLDSVAIRMPDNKIALELIRLSKCPLAAPSANLSGKPSPTCARHVIDDLNGKLMQ
jgi:L-threonylcarbamoyladenylate synthase